MKRTLIILSLLCLGVGSVLVYSHIEKKVTRFELPQGELKWSDVKPESAKILAEQYAGHCVRMRMEHSYYSPIIL